MLNVNDVNQIYLGCQGENLARTIVINVAPWLVAYPSGNIAIWHKRNGESEATATGAIFDPEAGTLTWKPTSTDTYAFGEGEAEIRLSEGSVIKKSRTVKTDVAKAVTGPDGTAIGSEWENYLDAIQRAAGVAIIKNGQIRFAINSAGHLILSYTDEVPIPADDDAETIEVGDITWFDKDLGPVDVYAEAVAAGYTGTKEEWLLEVGSVKENAQAAAESEEAAAGSAEAAAGSATQAAGSATSAAASAADALQHTQSVIETWLGNNIDPDSGYALDRTLALSSAAAPADMVGDLKSAIDYSTGTRLEDFVQGSIGSPSGDELAVNTFSRSDFYDVDRLLYIDKPTPIRCLVCYYDSTKTMLGRKDYPLSSAAVIYRNDILALNGATKYVRFVVGINGQNTSPEDVVASNINIVLAINVEQEIDNASNNIMNVLGNPSAQSYYEQSAITVTSGKELTKFYPESGKTYNIYAFGLNNSELRLFEFYEGGSYSTLAKLSNNERFHYTPGANVNYLRIYLAVLDNTTQMSGKAVVLNYEGIMSNDTASDYMLSKEFAAVRKFTVIGDSLASGYYKESASGAQYPRNIDYSWPQIMARNYGQTAQNASKSGATCATWWEDSADNCKAMVTADNRSQVYIMALGTNDYKDVADADITAAQIGSSSDINTSDYTQNTDSFWGNYCKILQYVHDVAPDAKIICLTIPQPRPDTTWKQTAIRQICAYSLFTDYVVLCDLEKLYNDLSNSRAMQSEMWQGHFTPVGYANSAEFLMYALSKTIQANRAMFINLPQIPYDLPVSEAGVDAIIAANASSAVDITANTTYINVVSGKYVTIGNYVYFSMTLKYVHAISTSLSSAITNLPDPVYNNIDYPEYGVAAEPTDGVMNHTNGWRIVGAHAVGDVRRLCGRYLKAA